MHILFIHEVDYLGKPIYEIHEFPEHLAKLGHKVTFLEFNENIRMPKPKRSRLISGRVLPEVQLQLETPYYIGVSKIDRILGVFSVIPKLISLFRNQIYDVVILYAVPTYGIQSIIISKLFGVPLVHRALDVPHKIRKTLYEPLISFSEKLVYKYSPAISSNNASLASYCDDRGSRTKSSEVHLPPLDTHKFKPAFRSKNLAMKLALDDDDEVIAYLGSFFYFSGLPQVIEDFGKLSASNPKLKLLLIGGGEQESLLRNLVSQYNLQNRVVFTGFIPFTDIPKYLALATVAINPMESVISSNLALPHKVFQYLACGLPVVSTKLSGIHATLGDSCGVTWVKGPSNIIASAISLIHNQSLRAEQSVIAQKSIVEKFEMVRVIDAFESFVFKQIEAGEK